MCIRDSAKGTNGYVTATDGKKTNSYEDKDDGVYVKKGDTAPYVTKTADKETANVGDKLTYTVKVGNGDGAVSVSYTHLDVYKRQVLVCIKKVYPCSAAAYEPCVRSPA